MSRISEGPLQGFEVREIVSSKLAAEDNCVLLIAAVL